MIFKRNLTPLAAAFFILASASLSQSAPSTTWVRQFGNPGADSGTTAVADGSGGVFVGGQLSHPGGAGINGFIYRFDPFGAKTLSIVIASGHDEDVRDLTTDDSGNIFATGVTTGSLGAPFKGALDIYVGRFFVDGSTVWMRQFGTSDYDVPMGIATNSAQDIYIVGQTAGELTLPNLSNYDAFAMKLDYDGNVAWTRQFGSNSFDTADDVWADVDGNAYMAGRSGNDAYVWKFDTQGNLVWTRTLTTTAFDTATAIKGDGIGNIYVSGVTDGALMGSNRGDRDAFVAKFSDSGNLEWITQIGTSNSDGALDLAIDPSGNPYVSGWTGGTLGSTNKGGLDGLISKLDSSGHVIFTTQIGTAGEDSAYGVAVDALGNFFATGYVRGNLAGTLSGTDDAWVAKFAVPEPSSVQFVSVAALVLFAAPGVSRRANRTAY